MSSAYNPIIPAGLLYLTESFIEQGGTSTGRGDGFFWTARSTPAGGGEWHEVVLSTERDLHFNPAMIMWLGTLDNMNDRQAHTWRQTILRAPTVNQNGLGGNDLAAGYLYDHEQRTETIIYFPADSLSWSPHRFYELTLKEVLEYRPIPRYGIGLIPSTPASTFTFAPGKHSFRVWVYQKPCDEVPSPWEAQGRLIAAVAPLLDSAPMLYPDAPTWGQMARGTLADLADDACWVEAGGKRGLRAYVKGSSGVGRDNAKGFELMTQLDVLLPLLHWRNRTGESAADGIIERLLDAVRAYQIIAPFDYLPNHYPYTSSDTFMDTWYFYENALIKLPWVAHLTGDSDFKQTFLTALEGGQRLAQNSHYLFPLFADAAGWHSRGSLLNAGVGGMYAAGCVLAEQLTGDPAYLVEASTALNTIHQLPPHQLTHEPQQLSFAAAAAAYLNQPEMAADFVKLSLRMGYWGKDPAVPFYDPRGMFQACASLSYPAYKENVEVIWAWSELLADDQTQRLLPAPLLAGFANLQRCHNYAFFDAFLPEAMRRGPCAYVPYEDLATAEFTHTAVLGKEIYGAGEVFWSALLFERPAFLENLPDDVLIFALDVPCLRLNTASSGSRRWLVYNPRQARIELSGTSAIILEPQSVHFMEGT